MKNFILLTALVFVSVFAFAQSANTIFNSGHHFDSPFPGCKGLGNNFYNTTLLGIWFSEDGRDKIEVIRPQNGNPLSVNIYTWSGAQSKYTYQYTRYLPHTTIINDKHYFFDYNPTIDAQGNAKSNQYVSCNYYFNGNNDLYIKRINLYHGYASAQSTQDYNRKMQEVSTVFAEAVHFVRQKQTANNNDFNQAVGTAILIGGAALLLDALFLGDNSNSPSTYSTSGTSLSPLGLDYNHQPVYDYRRQNEIKYDNDGNPKY